MVEKRSLAQIVANVQPAKRAKREAAEEYRQMEREAKRKRVLNLENVEKRRRNELRRAGVVNEYGGMRAAQVAQKAYERVLDKVMRQSTYTATDFKYLGIITKAYRDSRWSELLRAVRAWQSYMKGRVCRMKKADMQSVARGLNVDVTNKNTRKTICDKIKNKL